MLIKGRFFKLCQKVAAKLSTMDIDIESLTLAVLELFDSGDFIGSSGVSSVKEIFRSITKHRLWDYSNYTAVEFIVEMFAHDDQDLMESVKQYKEDLNGFKAATKIIDYINACHYDEDPGDNSVQIRPVFKSLS